jgi:Family of unknown function (DUF5988)
MNETDPNAILRGGPASLSAAERIRYIANCEERFKLSRESHYDHFDPTSATESHDNVELRVFEWVGCTYVAE